MVTLDENVNDLQRKEFTTNVFHKELDMTDTKEKSNKELNVTHTKSVFTNYSYLCRHKLSNAYIMPKRDET